jgi:hypothetical protein
MTLSTSAVAVCCCRDSRSSSEQACILDRDRGLIGKSLHQGDPKIVFLRHASFPSGSLAVAAFSSMLVASAVAQSGYVAHAGI